MKDRGDSDLENTLMSWGKMDINFHIKVKHTIKYAVQPSFAPQ